MRCFIRCFLEWRKASWGIDSLVRSVYAAFRTVFTTFHLTLTFFVLFSSFHTLIFLFLLFVGLQCHGWFLLSLRPSLSPSKQIESILFFLLVLESTREAVNERKEVNGLTLFFLYWFDVHFSHFYAHYPLLNHRW